MKVAIDPGHGGRDPGAVANGLKEKDITLDVGKQVAAKLEWFGYCPLMTRDDDEYITLSERADIANKNNAEVFVSIHTNAAANANANGCEVWTSPGKTDADILADMVLSEWVKAFPEAAVRANWTDGDIDKEFAFTVLIKTRMPAVIVEMAFITNKAEAQNMSDKVWQDKAASAIATGIHKYLSVKER